MKMARPWFSGSAAQWEDPQRPLKLDAGGNVLRLLPGQVARTVLFSGRPADPGLALRQFLVLWEGQGALQYDNVDVSIWACAHAFVCAAAPARAADLRTCRPWPNHSHTRPPVIITTSPPLRPLRRCCRAARGGTWCG